MRLFFIENVNVDYQLLVINNFFFNQFKLNKSSLFNLYHHY